ncbi:type II toxin-antitoxin system HicA family toxin [Pseudomonas amygdali]|uniref:type II toxin-antitoxin system HicA family toxin n=1 Tax=Pseudomonas amygdali TaxID=47877 RepID=UPI000A615029|nr:type II toxin-antitoxin system HicA family toxin [Pseudomonas amygdali]
MRYLYSENSYQKALMQVISPRSLGADAPSPCQGFTYNGKATIFADHGSKEMHEGLRKSIIKQLGLKD